MSKQFLLKKKSIVISARKENALLFIASWNVRVESKENLAITFQLLSHASASIECFPFL